ncbi:hypothetical protein [Caballeronia pedi]|nr:hypothetical protein [Caballeronia pedi]
MLRLEQRKLPKHPDWITQAIMRRHPLPKVTKHADFYEYNTRANVREAVAAQVRRAKLNTEAVPDRQGVLEGFERLQKEYLVERDGTEVAMPIESMSDEQLMEQFYKLQAMEKGLFQHGQEILRYIDLRRSARTGT